MRVQNQTSDAEDDEATADAKHDAQPSTKLALCQRAPARTDGKSASKQYGIGFRIDQQDTATCIIQAGDRNTQVRAKFPGCIAEAMFS